MAMSPEEKKKLHKEQMKQARKKLAAKQANAENDDLNPRERIFVNTYLTNNWNGTRAAMAAKYAAPAVTASKLLKKANVKRAIDAALQESQLSAKQVLARLSEMATADISEFTDENGNVDFKKVRRKGYLVKKLRTSSTKRKNEETEEEVVEANHSIELHDAQSALDRLGKVHGLFTEKVEVTGKDGGAFEFVVKVSPDEMP